MIASSRLCSGSNVIQVPAQLRVRVPSIRMCNGFHSLVRSSSSCSAGISKSTSAKRITGIARSVTSPTAACRGPWRPGPRMITTMRIGTTPSNCAGVSAGSVRSYSIQTDPSQPQAQSQTQSQPSRQQPKIPIIRTLPQLRRWRKEARAAGLEVGVVPTMGALHEGHLDLVRTSLRRHPLTVMTLFVNPMQFAPHEDLSKYPRTFEKDLALLRTLLPPIPDSRQRSMRGLGISEYESSRPTRAPSAKASTPSPSNASSTSSSTTTSTSVPGNSNSNKGRSSDQPSNGIISTSEIPNPQLSPLIIFAPTPDVMYPLKGELQDLNKHRGVSVELKGWGELMEGASRPQFFKGVATVCTKLFNAVEPDHAYFGQKDIQQALLLKILVQDLLLSHPSPENLHILPTTRSATGLALSSRNTYLSEGELAVSPVLYRALTAARDTYLQAKDGSWDEITGEELIGASTRVILNEQERIFSSSSSSSSSASTIVEQVLGAAGGGAGGEGSVELTLDYIEVFDKYTFEPIRGPVGRNREFVIAGAVWVGKTRLIDNLLVGWEVA